MSDASSGLTSLQFNILSICGAFALLLVAANVGLSLNNRQVQEEVNARQQFINQTVELNRLNNQIAQALANLSVKTGDTSIRRLLADNGITFATDAEAAAAQEAQP